MVTQYEYRKVVFAENLGKVDHGGYMESTAKPIAGFPDYLIDRDGTIYTVYKHRVRRPSFTREGAVKITLFRDGQAFTKSLPRLVAENWLYNDYDPEIFDTPIHLDNDLSNNHVDNLAWRPRWFAVKYQRQYWNEEYRYSHVKIEDVQTGEVYSRAMDVCQKYGLLFIDVLNSCIKGTEVFPTWKTFSFV